MRIRLALVLILVGLLLGAVAGYQFGTRKLAAVQANLDKLRDTLDAQKTAYDTTVARLQQQAREADSAHQAEQQRLQARAEADRGRLEGLNRDAGLRLTQAQARLAALATERSGLLTQRTQARPAQRAELDRRDAQLAREEAGARQLAAGLACLGEPVPPEHLEVLSQVASR